MTHDVRFVGRPHPAPVVLIWPQVGWPEALFALGIIAAPLAVGGVHVATQIALAAMFLVAFAGATWRLSRQRRVVRVGWVGLGLLIALAWSFLQWLPLPAGVVEVLSPSAWEARHAVSVLAGSELPGWMPLALDAGRAAAGVVSLLALTLAYLTATSLRSNGGDARHRIIIYVELAALGVLVSALVHQLLGLEAIWGIYQPVTADLPDFPSSFVNPNHAAALMCLGAIVAFGSMLSERYRSRWHLVVGILLACGVVASLSRANALLLVGAVFALTLPPILLRRLRPERRGAVRLLLGALGCVFIAVIVVGPERWLSELASLGDAAGGANGLFSWSWPVGLAAIDLSPAVGLGAGGFAVTSPALAAPASNAYLAYAHNGAIQVLVDLGVIVGVVVIALVVGGAGRAAFAGLRRREVGLSSWALAVALAALALQNLADFSLWIAGVGIPAAALLGTLILSSWPAERARSQRWRWPAWGFPMWSWVILAGVLVVTAVPAHRDRPAAWKASAAHALATAEPTSVDRLRLVETHPHDYLAFDFAAALANASGQREEAVRWLERALVLAPHDLPTVEAAAGQRLRVRDEAGALELIERLDPDALGSPRAVSLVLSAPWARTLHETFFGRSPRRAVSGARLLVERDETDRADALLVWALARFPESVELSAALGARRWHDAAFLDRLATIALTTAARDQPDSERDRWEHLAYLFQARVEQLSNHPLNAYQLYRTAAAVAPEGDSRALLEAGKLADSVGRADWLDEIVERLGELEIRGAWPRGQYHLLRSRAAERREDLDGAIREMHAVLRTLDHVPSMHARLADLYLRAGDPEAAARARARAERLADTP